MAQPRDPVAWRFTGGKVFEDRLKVLADTRVGGGGTITDEEAKTLETYGVEKIYLPEDGQRLGLEGMAKDIIARARTLKKTAYAPPRRFGREDIRAAGRTLSLIETGLPFVPVRRKRKDWTVPVVGEFAAPRWWR